MTIPTPMSAEQYALVEGWIDAAGHGADVAGFAEAYVDGWKTGCAAVQAEMRDHRRYQATTARYPNHLPPLEPLWKFGVPQPSAQWIAPPPVGPTIISRIRSPIGDPRALEAMLRNVLAQLNFSEDTSCVILFRSELSLLALALDTHAAEVANKERLLGCPPVEQRSPLVRLSDMGACTRPPEAKGAPTGCAATNADHWALGDLRRSEGGTAEEQDVIRCYDPTLPRPEPRDDPARGTEIATRRIDRWVERRLAEAARRLGGEHSIPAASVDPALGGCFEVVNGLAQPVDSPFAARITDAKTVDPGNPWDVDPHRRSVFTAPEELKPTLEFPPQTERPLFPGEPRSIPYAAAEAADVNPETGKPWETMTEAELLAGLAKYTFTDHGRRPSLLPSSCGSATPSGSPPNGSGDSTASTAASTVSAAAPAQGGSVSTISAPAGAAGGQAVTLSVSYEPPD